MVKTSNKLSSLLAKPPVRDIKKLKEQQEYYKRLMDNGTAQKQTYNLKSVASI